MTWRKARASDKEPPVDADEATPEMFAAAKLALKREGFRLRITESDLLRTVQVNPGSSQGGYRRNPKSSDGVRTEGSY